VFQIESASLSDPGRKRQNNEDFIASFEPEDPDELNASGCLYIAADGVGGAIKGEKASRYAAQKVLFEYYRHPELTPTERLRESMRRSGNDIFNYTQDNHESRMATTMVAAAIKDNALTIANVGDSRVYLIRGENIQQITHDHSLVGEMVRDGLMSEEESHNSKVKNLLTRSLGGELDVHIDIFPDIPLLPGDRILLCTDGLSRYAGRVDLYALSRQGSPEEVVKKLVDYANHKGGADNTSAILIEIGSAVSGQEPILKKSRQLLQAVTDWENIPTLVGEDIPPKRDLIDKYKIYIPWGILALVCLFSIGGLVSWKLGLFGTGIPVSTLIPSGTQQAIIPTVIAQTPVIPTGTGSFPGVAVTTTPILTVSATLSATVASEGISPTKTITAMAVVTDSSPVTGSPVTAVPTMTQDPRICIYETGPGQSLWAIFSIFNIDCCPNSAYYRYDCQSDADPDNCGDPIKISDIQSIQDGWWIEIPGVSGEACTSQDGRLISP
jgi:serine/threonine protein phosphatase PrpC